MSARCEACCSVRKQGKFRKCDFHRAKQLAYVHRYRGKPEQSQAQRQEEQSSPFRQGFLRQVREKCDAYKAKFVKPLPNGQCQCLGNPSRGICYVCGLPDACESCEKRKSGLHWSHVLGSFRMAWLCVGCRSLRQARANRNRLRFYQRPKKEGAYGKLSA